MSNFYTQPPLFILGLGTLLMVCVRHGTLSDYPLDIELTLKDHKRFKHAKDVPPDDVIQFLKPSILGQILVHHKHVLTLPSSFLNEPNDMFGEVKMVAAKTYSIKQFWYIDYEVIAPDVKRLQYRGRTWQVPIIRGTAKSTAHNANVVNLLKQIYETPSTLSDIGITSIRSDKVYKLVVDMTVSILLNEVKRSN